MFTVFMGILFVCVSVLALYSGVLVYLAIFQRRFLYKPDETPLSVRTLLMEHHVIDVDGVRGYFLKRSPDKVLVFFHGNSGRAVDYAYIDELAAAANMSILMIEYPGFAGKGKANIANILACAAAVNEYLKKHTYATVVVVSESLGTGPGSYMVSLPNSVATHYIAITPFDSMANVIAWRYPILPVRLLLRDNYTPNVWLPKTNIATPIRFFLAGRDEVVGVEQGERLYSLIADRPDVSKVTIPAVSHGAISDSSVFREHMVHYLSSI